MINNEYHYRLNPSFLNYSVNSNIYGSVKKIVQKSINHQERVQKYFRRLNITFPARIKNEKLQLEIIANRLNYKKYDRRPIALILYPKVDEDRSFERNDILSLYEKGYKVIYFEVGTDREIYNLIKKVGRFKKIDLLILGGHGNRKSISLGAKKEGQPLATNDALYLDLNDFYELLKQELYRYTKQNCKIILESCSTEKGGKKAWNVANMIRTVFKNNNVIAPYKDVQLGQFTFNRFNKVVNENFIYNENKVYEIGRQDPEDRFENCRQQQEEDDTGNFAGRKNQ